MQLDKRDGVDVTDTLKRLAEKIAELEAHLEETEKLQIQVLELLQDFIKEQSGHTGYRGAVLTDELVIISRKLIRMQAMTVAELADIIGINKGTLSKAVNAKTWSHLPTEE